MSTSLHALGFTLLHFTWQAALIAGVVALSDVLAPKLNARTRYMAGLCALIAMCVAAVLTFGFEYLRLSREAAEGHLAALSVASLPSPYSVLPPVTEAMTPNFSLRPLLPWLDAIWLMGVVVLSLKMAAGLWHIEHLSRTATSVPDNIARRFAQALGRHGLKGRVSVRLHAGITGPFVVGVFRSVVYLPLSAITRLNPDQLDAILAHELEHIRRADFAWNLLQTVMETLFFYHPAVWWLNRRLREQRELCCDDVALETCRDPLIYATALLRLEESRRGSPALGMALNGDGDGASLLGRISRMLGEAPAKPKARRQPPLLALPLLGLTVVAFASPVAQVAASTEPVRKIATDLSNLPVVKAALPVVTPPTPPAPVAAPAKPAKPATPEVASDYHDNGEREAEEIRLAIEEAHVEISRAVAEADREREQAMREAQRDREQAYREAQREREQAMREASREREQALRMAALEREQALREADQARSEAERDAARERLYALKEAARTAERAANDQRRQADESAREAEELAREARDSDNLSHAESVRLTQQAQAARNRANADRHAAESARMAASRVSAEANRKSADVNRLRAEANRVRAEANRAAAARFSAEAPPTPPSPPAYAAVTPKAPAAPKAPQPYVRAPSPAPSPSPAPNPNPTPNPKPAPNGNGIKITVDPQNKATVSAPQSRTIVVTNAKTKVTVDVKVEDVEPQTP